MIFHVPLEELLSSIKQFPIEFLQDDVPGKILVQFQNYVPIGQGSFVSKIHSLLISHSEGKVDSVQLYMIANPSETQSLWTYILHYGLFNLELYPIMIDEESLPVRLILAPIKY